jgi:hypothetical protein
VKRLCTVVIWKPPTNPQGLITGYQICFGDESPPECYNYTADDNFHVTSEQQTMDNVDVRVRTMN